MQQLEGQRVFQDLMRVTDSNNGMLSVTGQRSFRVLFMRNRVHGDGPVSMEATVGYCV